MKKKLILGLLLFYTSLWVSGQKSDSLLPPMEFTLIARVNQGNSYITFPTDIGNIEPLWFEGNIIPNFHIRKSRNSRLMGVLTPQIIIRMYQEESFPVRTPGYLPQITVYYNIREKQKFPDLYIYGRVAHHSNGQDGVFYLGDDELNYKSGNFSTNFMEFGLIATRVNTMFKAYQFFKTSLEWHPDASMLDELKGIYSQYRWHTAMSIFKLSQNTRDSKKKPAFSIKGELTWMFGKYDQAESFDPERLNLSLTFSYHPEFLEDIGLFMQLYHGSDYYNIYFGHRLDILRFGFITETLRF